jgi:preprotein translocase subunit YajC
MIETGISLQGLVLAMAAPADGNASPWTMLIPWVAVLAIFYVLIFMPMRKQKKQVQDFRAGLKVSDRVVTSGGIYGTITKIEEQSIKVQIADKVIVELSKNAVVGYQGQAPVTPDSQ